MCSVLDGFFSSVIRRGRFARDLLINVDSVCESFQPKGETNYSTFSCVT